jgi:hypothetical protein
MEVSLHFGGALRCGGAVTERGNIVSLLATVFAHFNTPLDIYESSSPYASHHFFDLVWVTLNEEEKKIHRSISFRRTIVNSFKQPTCLSIMVLDPVWDLFPNTLIGYGGLLIALVSFLVEDRRRFVLQVYGPKTTSLA